MFWKSLGKREKKPNNLTEMEKKPDNLTEEEKRVKAIEAECSDVHISDNLRNSMPKTLEEFIDRKILLEQQFRAMNEEKARLEIKDINEFAQKLEYYNKQIRALDNDGFFIFLKVLRDIPRVLYFESKIIEIGKYKIKLSNSNDGDGDMFWWKILEINGCPVVE